jgi:hypothetical protein
MLLLGTAQAEPPKIIITPAGETVIQLTQGTITVKADGSMSIKGPNIDLALPGVAAPVDPIAPIKPNPPIDPIAPEADPLAELVGTLYGSLQEEGKAEKTKALSQVWLRAVALVDKAETVGDIVAEMNRIQTLKAEDIKPIREYLRDEVLKELGSKSSAKLDKAKARALFARIASALQKAVG